MSNLIAVRNALRDADRALSSAEIRGVLDWQAPIVSGTLSYMVRAKMLDRVHTPEGLRYALTDKGRALLPRTPQSERAWVEHRATSKAEAIQADAEACAKDILTAKSHAANGSSACISVTADASACSETNAEAAAASTSTMPANVSELVRDVGRQVEPPTSQFALPPDAGGDEVDLPESVLRHVRELETSLDALRQVDQQLCRLRDPVGLYERLCAICDDASELAIDGVTKELPADVLQLILHASRDLNRAARAFARSATA